MRLPCTARFVIAAAFVSSASVCAASEIDAPTESTHPSTASHGLFSSWFGSKVAHVDAPVVDAGDNEPEPPRPLLSIATPRAGDLVVGALSLLGIGYRFGGNSPESGFDCSGLVRYVFQTAAGLDLPRRAEEISRFGAPIDARALRPGDLVFYRTLRKAFSHVGIYLGGNRFIHAPSAGGSVRVDDMTQAYWTARFNGARRIGS